jgi:DNA primase
VIFPATERTPEFTKLDIAKYYVSVEDGIMRALRSGRRPSSAGPRAFIPTWCWRPVEDPRSGDAFFQKRVPKGAPDYLETARIAFPSGRTADEVCPTEIAVVAWCAHMGTITFHPWPVRSDDGRPPDELRLDLDPQPGTDFDDAARVAPPRASCSRGWATPAFPRPPGAGASTSTSGSSRAGASRTSATRRSRSDASSSGACPAR